MAGISGYPVGKTASDTELSQVGGGRNFDIYVRFTDSSTYTANCHAAGAPGSISTVAALQAACDPGFIRINPDVP
jgi:hypothetical protein